MIAASLLFRALSDATRIRILQFLQRGELCVGDLVALLRVPQAKTSRHLATLRRAGLVRGRQAGPWVFYSMIRSRDRIVRDLAAILRLVRRPPSDVRRERELRKAGGCCP